MNNDENAVFFSYAWGGESEEIVNKIDETLSNRGIRIVRDKRDIIYKGSIKEFMERIGRSNCVIVVISNKYLCSKNCMFELVEIAENKQFADRIFPIVLADARIYDPVDRLDYVEYWQTEKAKLNKRIKKLDDVSNLQGISEELNSYDRIREKISGLTSILKDMNTFTSEIHVASGFSALISAVEQVVKPPPPPPNQASKTGSPDRGTEIAEVRAVPEKKSLLDELVEGFETEEADQKRFDELLDEEIKNKQKRK